MKENKSIEALTGLQHFYSSTPSVLDLWDGVLFLRDSLEVMMVKPLSGLVKRIFVLIRDSLEVIIVLTLFGYLKNYGILFKSFRVNFNE